MREGIGEPDFISGACAGENPPAHARPSALARVVAGRCLPVDAAPVASRSFAGRPTACFCPSVPRSATAIEPSADAYAGMAALSGRLIIIRSEVGVVVGAAEPGVPHLPGVAAGEGKVAANPENFSMSFDVDEIPAPSVAHAPPRWRTDAISTTSRPRIVVTAPDGTPPPLRPSPEPRRSGPEKTPPIP